MKKQFILCGLAAATVGLAFASVDKLNFVKNDEVIKTIRINSIDHISYQGEEDAFTHIDVTSTDGTVTSYSLDGIDHLDYVKGLPENPISVEVEPHHACATLHVTTSDPNAYYRFSGMPESELKGVPEDQWLDYLVQDDIDYIYNISDASGIVLDKSYLPHIFEQGNNDARDWFPPVMIGANTPIALAVYTATISDGKVVLTTEPELIRFTTKELYDLGVKFKFDFDATSTTLTVKANPYHPEGGDADIPYAIELYSADQIASNTLPTLVSNSLAQYENLVYNYGQKWDEVTFRGQGQKTYKNRRQGDWWLAVAFGCEYGVATTDATYEWIEIPEAVVTDECTFNVTFSQISGSEGTFTITPSDPNTRYTTFLVESSRFEGEKAVTPSYYIADQVYTINFMNTFQWPTTDYVHTGASDLNSKKDVINGKYLLADVEYSLLVCGVDEVGGRTTEIKELRFKTSTKPKPSDEPTFDIKFSNFDDSSQYYHFIEVTVNPSNPDMQYVINSAKMTSTYFPESMSDEDFMKKYLDAQGGNLKLESGELTKKLSFSAEYEYPAGYVWKQYVVYVFGYDGGVTTPLYAYLVDTGTGEVTPYRVPEPKPVVDTFDISFSNFDDSSQYYHFIEVTINPSNPDMQYVINSAKMTSTYFPESMSDEDFMKKYLDAQGGNLKLESGELTKKLSFSAEYEYPAGYVWKQYVVYVFGYDGGVTTPLYAYLVDTGTGEVTPYRVPEK